MRNQIVQPMKSYLDAGIGIVRHRSSWSVIEKMHGAKEKIDYNIIEEPKEC